MAGRTAKGATNSLNGSDYWFQRGRDEGLHEVEHEVETAGGGERISHQSSETNRLFINRKQQEDGSADHV